jgi:hypothetical protein
MVCNGNYIGISWFTGEVVEGGFVFWGCPEEFGSYGVRVRQQQCSDFRPDTPAPTDRRNTPQRTREHFAQPSIDRDLSSVERA